VACPELPFASFTLNVGRHSISLPHKDGGNLAAGLCYVAPFGSFDHTLGGHLILHELKLVVEIPSGGSILFPSGLITHENIPISDNEERRAITGYTSGGLFQWVENGFQKARTFNSNVEKVKYGDIIWGESIRHFPHILQWTGY
jgi:hypothetical protein